MPKSKPNKPRERRNTPPSSVTAAAGDEKSEPVINAPGGPAPAPVVVPKKIAPAATSTTGDQSLTRRDVFFSRLSVAMSKLSEIPNDLIRIIFEYSQSSNDLALVIPTYSVNGGAYIHIWCGDVFDGYMDDSYRRVIYDEISQQTLTEAEPLYSRFRAVVPPIASLQTVARYPLTKQRGGAPGVLIVPLTGVLHYPYGSYVMFTEDELTVWAPLTPAEKVAAVNDELERRNAVAVAAAATGVPVAPPLVRQTSVPPPAPTHYRIVKRLAVPGVSAMIALRDTRAERNAEAKESAQRSVLELIALGSFSGAIYVLDVVSGHIIHTQHSVAAVQITGLLQTSDGRLFACGADRVYVSDPYSDAPTPVPVRRTGAMADEIDRTSLVNMFNPNFHAPPAAPPPLSPAEQKAAAAAAPIRNHRTLPFDFFIHGRDTMGLVDFKSNQPPPISELADDRYRQLIVLPDGHTVVGLQHRVSEKSKHGLSVFDCRRRTVAIDKYDPVTMQALTETYELTDRKWIEIKYSSADENSHACMTWIAPVHGSLVAAFVTGQKLRVYDVVAGVIIAELNGPAPLWSPPIITDSGMTLVGLCGRTTLAFWRMRHEKSHFLQTEPYATQSIKPPLGQEFVSVRLAALPFKRIAVATELGVQVFSTETLQCEVPFGSGVEPGSRYYLGPEIVELAVLEI